MLTLLIGGNHEASSYFWELYAIHSTIEAEADSLHAAITEDG